MRPYRAASTRRAGLRQCCSSCCWKRILVNKGVERRRTGVSQHHPSHEKAALAPLRLPSAAQTAAFHSKYRLEAAPHPFGRPDFINFRYYFRVRAPSRPLLAGLARSGNSLHRVRSAPSRGSPRRTWAFPRRAQMAAPFSFCAPHPGYERRLAKTEFAMRGLQNKKPTMGPARPFHGSTARLGSLRRCTR